jgi:hypothetical protein
MKLNSRLIIVRSPLNKDLAPKLSPEIAHAHLRYSARVVTLVTQLVLPIYSEREGVHYTMGCRLQDVFSERRNCGYLHDVVASTVECQILVPKAQVWFSSPYSLGSGLPFKWRDMFFGSLMTTPNPALVQQMPNSNSLFGLGKGWTSDDGRRLRYPSSGS